MKIDDIKKLKEIVTIVGDRSYCKRLNVGAVIARDGRPLVTGYNGTISGTDNCCEETIEYYVCERCDSEYDEYQVCTSCGNGSTYIEKRNRLKTSDFVIHAEQNAIFYAARNGLNTEGTSIYVTHAPCPNCAKAIASAGIKRVVYKEEYRDDRGIQFLKDCKVEVTLLN